MIIAANTMGLKTTNSPLKENIIIEVSEKLGINYLELQDLIKNACGTRLKLGTYLEKKVSSYELVLSA